MASASIVPVFQSSLVIASELTSTSLRSWAIAIACISWSVGACLLPLAAWLISEWRALQVASAVPFLLIFTTFKVMPESPRWMISKGKRRRATTLITYIAVSNKAEVQSSTLKEKVKELIRYRV